MKDGSGMDSNGVEYKHLTLYFNTYDEKELENFRNMVITFLRSRDAPKKEEWESKD